MVYVLTASELTNAEFALAQSVQGILNRKDKKVYIDIDEYMKYMTESYERVGLWRLVEECAAEFEGGAVYDLDCNDVSVNMAATVSAAYDIIGVPRELVARTEAAGIKTERPTKDNASCSTRLNTGSINPRLYIRSSSGAIST